MFELFELYADHVGEIGVVITLLAYLGISTGKLSSNSLKYQLLNCIAGCMLLFSLYYHWNRPAVIMESLWVLISVIGIVRILIVKPKL